MEQRVILPRTYMPKIEKPLIFLAGPIRGAPDWQEEAIQRIITNNREVIIANPRWDARGYVKGMSIRGDENHFKRQRQWEKYYLEIAAKTGCVMFWLANAPGYMTRLELGLLMGEYKINRSPRFCVGGDPRFLDIETIRYDLIEDTRKIIYSSLAETCNTAIKLATEIK